MADHFMDTLNLRLRVLTEQVESELEGVQRHFGELRLFTTAGLDRLRADVDVRLRYLDGRIDAVESGVRTSLEETLAALRDIQRRLPRS